LTVGTKRAHARHDLSAEHRNTTDFGATTHLAGNTEIKLILRRRSQRAEQGGVALGSGQLLPSRQSHHRDGAVASAWPGNSSRGNNHGKAAGTPQVREASRLTLVASRIVVAKTVR
jgi:hypothetical protein